MDGMSRRYRDLDHVVTSDGRIHRVVGNLDSETEILAYNVYSPMSDGDRTYGGRRYRKHFTEDEGLPADVLETYGLIPLTNVVQHFDPFGSAARALPSLASSVWEDLYCELTGQLGVDSVGVFGSSMFGMHLTPAGKVRKDVDFVIEGLDKVGSLRAILPSIRERLGFTAVTAERQRAQYARYRVLFRNDRNSIGPIIARRWTGLQLSERVVTTIRVRDPAAVLPLELVKAAPTGDDVTVTGTVADADSSNLFPRRFTLLSDGNRTDVLTFWWKFSTPVRDGDQVSVRGTVIPTHSGPVIRLTNYVNHWLCIHGE